MRGPSDNEAYNGQPDPDAVEPAEVTLPTDAEIADALLPMDQALVAEIRGLVPHTSTQQEVLGRIVVRDNGPETVRLIHIGAATANVNEAAARDDPREESHSAAYYYMQGATDRDKILEFFGNREPLGDSIIGELNEIGAMVDREINGEAEAV